MRCSLLWPPTSPFWKGTCWSSQVRHRVQHTPCIPESAARDARAEAYDTPACFTVSTKKRETRLLLMPKPMPCCAACVMC